jgi:uncharacterized protein
VVVDGRFRPGRVASWIVNLYPFFPGIQVPSVVVMVGLEDAEDLLVPGGWAGAPDGWGLRIGLPVQVGFEENGEGFTLLVWEADV